MYDPFRFCGQKCSSERLGGGIGNSVNARISELMDKYTAIESRENKNHL